MSEVSLVVNGRKVGGAVEDRTLLVHYLRENLGLTGTHVGCDTSQCGACVVHVDGKAVKSCTIWPRKRRARPSSPSRGWPTAPTCILSRQRSASITGCNAGSAPRA